MDSTTISANSADSDGELGQEPQIISTDYTSPHEFNQLVSAPVRAQGIAATGDPFSEWWVASISRRSAMTEKQINKRREELQKSLALAVSIREEAAGHADALASELEELNIAAVVAEKETK